MSTSEIRKRLHNYVETAEGRKIKALSILLEDSIKRMQEDSGKIKKDKKAIS